MPTLDEQTPNVMTPLGDIRNIQLNEKVSETTYQILHPETNAFQVITNELRRFVSDEDKERWDNCALNNAASLQYKGAWSANVTYKKYDVVYYKQNVVIDSLVSSSTTEDMTMFYICIRDNTTGASTAPDYDSLSTNYWINIDFRSYLALKANTVRTVNSTSTNDLLVTFVIPGTNEYKSININENFKFNPSTGTLTVTNIVATKVTADTLEGYLDDTAKEAINYVTYERDENGTKVPGGDVGSAEIDDAIVGLQKRIDGFTNGSGGVVLGNKLTITKDGTNAAVFDGSIPVTVDIKQTYSTEEITDLLDKPTKKIQLKWLPDSVLGQLEYKGTWNANPNPRPNVVDTSVQVKGHYYIAANNGNYNPDGSLDGRDADANPTYYLTGDWAVYNGTGWDKVDNTDAVTMVNNRIGKVETYQIWSAATQFYRGDIVNVNDVLYICNAAHTSGATFAVDSEYWDLFGRTYTAADGIKIDGTVIKHSTTAPTSSSKETTLVAGQEFQIPSFTTDAFGHVNKIETNTITLGADFIDTVREIQVNGTSVLASNVKTPLNVGSTTWIKASYENNKLILTHKDNDSLGAKDLSAYKVTSTTENEDILYAGQGYAIPSFSIDGAGHVVLGEMKTFRLAESPFKHKHFNVSTDSTGAQVIEAYSATIANKTWVSKTENNLKFYLGSENPVGTTQMNFNGIFNATSLKQAGNNVLDSLLKIYHGKDLNNADLYGIYDASTKSLVAPDSGVVTGVYSAVAVNSKGIVTAGGQMVEFGTVADADPSDSLVIGGLFFRMHSTNDANA